MWAKSNVFRIERKTFAYIVAFLIALAAVTPVLADYLGPDRTVTETVDVCKVLLKKCMLVNGAYKYKTVNSWSCSLESKPWQSYPSSSATCNSINAGYEYWTISSTQKNVTTTYPPATVSSELQNCTLNNGWCNTAPQLMVSGTEPVLGYDIFAIEGSLNGQSFACSDDNCIVPLNEGNNTIDYWALSSWGDSSLKDTVTTKVDSQAPNITGTVSGTSGSNGWYLSPVSINGFASDATSGLANFTCTLDGTTLASCSSITMNNDGPHTVILTASDNAGNVRTLNQSASIDTQNPILTASLDGTSGSNSWYTAATLNASASDPTPGSGLAAIEYNIDNSNWIVFPAAGVLSLPNGKHSLDLRAVDNAGRTVSSSKTFWLDSAAPDITLSPNGTLGNNNWYTTNLNLSASTTDEMSGVDVFEYSLDSGSWTPYTVPLTLTDGIHSISFWSQDQAGLVKQVDSTLQIDTRPPQIAGNISGVLGSNGWYISDVALSASASDPTPGSGLDAFTYTLNGSAPTSYTSPINLSDGQHTIQFDAQDQAGLNYSIDQKIKVDTVHPALMITSAFPNWVKDIVTLKGTASDNGSGLSKVEISMDGGQSWQLVTGTTSWNYDWNTQNIPDGSYNIRIRVVDQAGLTSEQTVNIKSDNHAPQISLPTSWLQWSTVSLDVWDDFSGVSAARVEISDPENRYPKRVIELDPNQFPLSFKWDRRFGNNEVAPSGTYDVKVIASDNLGHTAEQDASVKVVLSILPAGPTATSQPYVRATSTPIPTYTVLPNLSPTITPTAVVSGFGEIEPTAQATSTPTYLPTPRETPTQTSIFDWFESFFSPNTNSTDGSTEITSPISTESRFPDSQSNILWGAAAAAMVGAATSYAQEERRKQQEEKERQAALAKEAEDRHDKMQARKLEKAEAQRAQEQAWEAARNQQQEFIGGVAAKLDRMDRQEEVNWITAQAELHQRYEEKKQQEYTIPGVDRKLDRMDQKEEAARIAAQEVVKKAEQVEAKIAADDVYVKPENWWEKTKSFVYDEIIQPVNSHVYKPFIEPAVDRTKEFIASESAWISENIYQPYIQPAVEKTKQFVMSEAAWLNENIYQPSIKPAIDKTMETAAKDLSWLNKNIYQPYLQPTIAAFNEKVYEPYIKPVFDKSKELNAIGVSWVNNNIYQPYIQPAVNYIDQNIYAPIFEPVVDDLSSLWDKYGDWVHSALDTVGFIPGLGDIADGLNGLIYLGEGRYIEASVSALAMIPLLGDLGKAGKWGVEIGAEVVEEVVEEVAEKVVKEVAEEVVEDVVKETVEDVAEKVAIEAGEELAEKVAKESLEEVTEKALQESGEELASRVVKESVEEGAEKVLKETTEKLTENTIKETSDEFVAKTVNETTQTISETSAEQVSETVAEQAAKEAVEEKTAQFVNSLKEKYGDQATDKFLRFCEKYDIDPYEVLTRPPAEGQSLIGWGLGIENAANPANHALMELNLTEEELKKILEKSTIRPESKIVVLGFGNTAKPYYALSDEIEGCHLSLPPEVWAPFENAKANFLVDINIPFVEKGIEERKIFIFNVDTDLITDPANARRFSLPELRLLEMGKNNYVNVPVGKYNAFVPEELLETFQQMLPAKLFE